MAFNLDDYEPVADRIERFWLDHPHGVIATELVHYDDKHFIVRAFVKRDSAETTSMADATGYAEEIIGSTNVNRTSALENCETSAIGRALANLGYAVKNRASREEMTKAQPEPRPRSGGRRGPTPTPEPQESHGNGAPSHLTPEQAIQVATIKKSLLARLEGDVEKSAELWEGTIRNFGLDPKQPLPADMIPAVEHAIKALLI